MRCGYGTLRTTGVRIQHQVYRRPAQRSQQLQSLTILIVTSHSILHAPPSLHELSGACANALADSEGTLESSYGGWEHLELLRSTGEGNRSVWEVCVCLLDRIAYFWWTHEILMGVTQDIQPMREVQMVCNNLHDIINLQRQITDLQAKQFLLPQLILTQIENRIPTLRENRPQIAPDP